LKFILYINHIKNFKIKMTEQDYKKQIEKFEEKIKYLENTNKKTLEASNKVINASKENNTTLGEKINILMKEREWIEALMNIRVVVEVQEATKDSIPEKSYNAIRDWIKLQSYNILDNRGLSDYQILQLDSKLGINVITLNQDYAELVKDIKRKIVKANNIEELVNTLTKIDKTLHLKRNHLNIALDCADYICIARGLNFDKIGDYYNDIDALIALLITTTNQNANFQKSNNFPEIFVKAFESIKVSLLKDTSFIEELEKDEKKERKEKEKKEKNEKKDKSEKE
jgi:hypothetical protein